VAGRDLLPVAEGRAAQLDAGHQGSPSPVGLMRSSNITPLPSSPTPPAETLQRPTLTPAAKTATANPRSD
jgi:hypothetical protein